MHTIALRKPQLPELMDRVSVDAGAKWCHIGVQLGLPNGKLQIINDTHNGQPQDCCMEMFDEWLNTDRNATWRKLINVLCRPAVGKNVLAMQLCEWLDAPFPN